MEARFPSITKEEFLELGFKQLSQTMDPNNDGVWSVLYRKDLNAYYDFDYLDIKWFCGTNRYQINRHTLTLRNIPGFEGFLDNKSDLKFILSKLDYSKFYDLPEKK